MVRFLNWVRLVILVFKKRAVGHRRRSSFAKASEDRGFAPARGDDGHDRSFITRDFNGVGGKENGTIPFYRRFFDGIIKIQKLQARIYSVNRRSTLRGKYLKIFENKMPPHPGPPHEP